VLVILIYSETINA